MKKIIPILALSFCLSGCQTPYQAKGFNGGFTETKLNDTMCSITFNGNRHTSESTVNQYLLKRASELTLQNNYRYFAVIGSHENENTSTYQTPDTFSGSNQAYYNGYGSGFGSAYSNGILFHGANLMRKSYENTIIIKMFKTQSKDGNLLDASMIH